MALIFGTTKNFYDARGQEIKPKPVRSGKPVSLFVIHYLGLFSQHKIDLINVSGGIPFVHGGPFISASRHDRHPKGVPFKGAPLPFQMGGRVLTITKAEIITRICDKAHLSKDDAFEIVENTLDIIKASLERGVTVKIPALVDLLFVPNISARGATPKPVLKSSSLSTTF